MASQLQRTQRREKEGDHGEEPERGERAEHEGEQQLDREAAGLLLGPTTPQDPGIGGHPFEGDAQRSPVASRTAKGSHQRQHRVSELVEDVEGVAQTGTEANPAADLLEGVVDRCRGPRRHRVDRLVHRQTGPDRQPEQVDHVGHDAADPPLLGPPA